MKDTITNIFAVMAVVQMVRSIYYYHFKKEYAQANNYLLWAILDWLIYKL